MSTQTRSLLQAGLALPDDERRALAEELLASLADEDDEAFAAELRRRREEAMQNPSCMLPISALDQDE